MRSRDVPLGVNMLTLSVLLEYQFTLLIVVLVLASSSVLSTLLIEVRSRRRFEDHSSDSIIGF